MREGHCSLCGERWSDHIWSARRGWPHYQCREGVRPDCGDCGRKMRLDYWVWTVSDMAEMVCYYCQNKKLAGVG